MYERRKRPFFERRESFDKPKPVKLGEEYTVKITDVGAKGDGITKIENFIIFVHGGKKGEECRIRIKEVANKFAIAEKIGEKEESEEVEETEEPTQEESEEVEEKEETEEPTQEESEE